MQEDSNMGINVTLIYMGAILHQDVYASVNYLSVWKDVRVQCYALCSNKLKEQNIIYC